MILEDPEIIKLNISHYRALLQLEMADERRSQIKKLLAEASSALVMSKDWRKPQT